MIGLSVQIEDRTKRVADAADKASFKNVGHAAARISKDAKESLDNAAGPSAPGTPPHTHRGQFLKRAIRYDATTDDALIGPQASIVGEAGRAHELGEDFHGQDFPERAFMGPALEANEDRFASDFAGSIGE